MLGAGAVGKFVGVAVAGRWTSSSRFALRDAVVAPDCSRCAGRVSEATATATTRAVSQRVRSRSELHELAISSPRMVARTIVIAIASFVCANAQRRA
jgi:hypothetical protein